MSVSKRSSAGLRSNVRTWTGALVAGTLALCCPACQAGKSPPPPVDAGSRLNDSAESYLSAATARYRTVIESDPQGERRVELVRATLRDLDLGLQNAPGSPLLLGLRGRTLLELGDVAAARASFEGANRAARNYPPTFIGLALCDWRERKAVAAAQRLADARTATDFLADLLKAKPEGLDLAPVRSLLADAQRDLAWDRNGVRGAAPAARTDASADAVALLRAKIGFHESMLSRPASDVGAFDALLADHPDYFPARFEKGRRMLSAGIPEAAVALLEPYATSDDARFAAYNDLLVAAGRALALSYESTGADGAIESGMKVAARLGRSHPWNADGPIIAARLSIEAGHRRGEPKLYDAARSALASARRLLTNYEKAGWTADAKRLGAEANALEARLASLAPKS